MFARSKGILRDDLPGGTARPDPAGVMRAGSGRFVVLLFLVALPPSIASAGNKANETPQSAVGERLFLETRFSQYFFRRSLGDPNARPRTGDITVATGASAGAALPGPFAGESMNCRACHLVDEQARSAGNRTYCDFARRSPVPDRGDGIVTTARNAPGMVGLLANSGDAPPLHLDGEFADAEDLVVEGFTGRNFGWLPGERAKAVAHIAAIIRGDDGTGPLARTSGGAYAVLLAGTDSTIPARMRLAPEWRIDVARASDEEILRHLARLVRAYMESLDFSRDGAGLHNGSPYDRFLTVNRLPRAPESGESPRDYSRRLLALIRALEAPRFVSAVEGKFRTHRQDFVFGPKELAGLEIFFSGPSPSGEGATSGKKGSGNCVACHAAPEFTDFRFHNTGASQEEYDDIHGPGAFAALPVPGLAERAADPAAFLPRSAAHPGATARFASPAEAEHPERTDLGLWNVFANADFPKPQSRLRALLAGPSGNVSDAALLEKALARFKTPTVRDPGQSAPYLHNGSKDTVEQVIRFYRDAGARTRAGLVRNADPELAGIRLSPADEPALAAFLRSLNEDYE